MVFPIGSFVKDNTCYRFFAIFILRYYSELATIFTFIRDVPGKLLFGRRYRAIFYLNTSRNRTLFQHITQLFPMLIHYRTIPYLNPLSRTKPFLNTIPNCTLSQNVTELFSILTHYRTIPYLNTLSQTKLYPNTLSRTKPYLNTLPKCTPS